MNKKIAAFLSTPLTSPLGSKKMRKKKQKNETLCLRHLLWIDLCISV